MFSIKKYSWLLLLLPFNALAQQREVLSLPEIIGKIDSNNILLKTYGLRAEGYNYSADAATAWMPPMVGVGTDVMKPVVLPMIGGVFTSAIHILLVTPLIFLMAKEYELRKYGKLEVYDVHH